MLDDTDRRQDADSDDSPLRDGPAYATFPHQRRRRLRVGEQVTIVPIPTDPYILNFQRYGYVARFVDAGYYVTVGSAMPTDTEFGPFPGERLLAGWQDEHGSWR